MYATCCHSHQRCRIAGVAVQPGYPHGCFVARTRPPHEIACFKCADRLLRIKRKAWWVRSEAGNGSLTSQQEGPQTTSDSPVNIPTRLNNIPHQREVRKWFYDDVKTAVVSAVTAGEKRIKVRITIPELNPEMDVFRIGTLLEMVREIATALAADGKRVKVSVQQAMGAGVFQGLPLSLSGVRRIMDAMDWGDAEGFVDFGEVGADQVDPADDFYVLIAPQNVVGNTIMTNLLEMVDAAEAQGKHVILVNPQLKDIPSSGGVMGVRGRKERMDFAKSFVTGYHFRLLYQSSAMMYPIMGALRKAYGGSWKVYRRVDIGKREEEYQLLGDFDTEPGAAEITPLFRPKERKPTWKQVWKG